MGRDRILLLALLALGLLLGFTAPLDWHGLHDRLHLLSGHPWGAAAVAAGLAAAMIALYALALPGSALILPAALLYSPAAAAALIAAGGALGALAAHGLSRRLGASWTAKAARSAAYRVLQRNSDFFTLCALRIVPGFPHSFLNYGAGLLGVPRGRLLLSAVAGFGVKGYLYAAAVHNVAAAGEAAELVRLATSWPLLALAALLLSGRWVRRFWERRTRH